VRKQRVGTQMVRHSLGTQYANSSFSVGGASVAIEAYAVCARRTERRDVHVVEALGGAVGGGYEQEAAVVEVDEEMELMDREDGRGVAKRSEGWRSGQTRRDIRARKGRTGIGWAPAPATALLLYKVMAIHLDASLQSPNLHVHIANLLPAGHGRQCELYQVNLNHQTAVREPTPARKPSRWINHC
jgi:hypothetical protein